MFLRINVLIYFGLLVVQNFHRVTIGQYIEPVLESEKTLELDHKSVTDALSIGKIAQVSRRYRLNKLLAQPCKAISELLSEDITNGTFIEVEKDYEQPSDEEKSLPSDCGKVFKVKPKISGGYDASPGQYPSYVQLSLAFESPRGVEVCGGVIISKHYVLTAGHCVEDAVGILVTPRWNTSSVDNRSYKAEKWCKSAEYTQDLRYDFAVVKLKEPLEFSKTVQPACLPVKPTKLKKRAHTVGLGVMSRSPEDGEEDRPERLQVLPVKSIECPRVDAADYRICFRSYDSRYEGDSCSGDSGGPIYMNVKKRATVVGLTSYGPPACIPGLINISINTYVFNVRSKILDLIDEC